MTSKKTYTRPDTILAVAGRDPDNNFGIVNPPVYHASTILSPTMEKFENRIPFEGYGYGRNGTPTQKALEDAVAAIEGAHRSIAVQSSLALSDTDLGIISPDLIRQDVPLPDNKDALQRAVQHGLGNLQFKRQ